MLVPPPPTSPNAFKRLISPSTKAPQTDFILSPSQFDLFLECERAAGFRYIDGWEWGEEEDKHGPKALGDRIHDILEDFANTGKKPDLHEIFILKGVFNGKPWQRTVYPGQVADVAICLIPPGAKAESEVVLTRPNGIRWRVKRDLRIHSFGVPPEVRDYKTTSDFKYVAEKDLTTDTQAQLYAWAEFVESPIATEVLLHWQFLRTKGKPDSQSLYHRENRASNEAQMARIDAHAERWIQIRRKGARGEIRGADLPPTGLKTGKCDKHFGCPHRGVRCFTTTEELLGAGFMDIDVRLAELTGKQTAMGAIPPPAAYVPAPAPVATARPSYWIPGDPLNPAQDYFKAQGAPLSKIANAADVPPPAEVAASYDRPVAQPAPVLTGPPVESGYINGPAPGNPTHAAVNPAQAAAFVQGTPVQTDPAKELRKRLKEEAVALGLVSQSSTMGAENLQKLIEGHKAAQAQGTFDASPTTYPARLDAAIEKQAPAYHAPVAPLSSIQQTIGLGGEVIRTTAQGPGTWPIPAPATAVVDDKLLDAIVDRMFSRLCAALLKSMGQ